MENTYGKYILLDIVYSKYNILLIDILRKVFSIWDLLASFDHFVLLEGEIQLSSLLKIGGDLILYKWRYFTKESCIVNIWQVESYKLRVTIWEWQVESDKLEGTSLEWQVESDKLKVTSQEWQDKSVVICSEWQVK